MLVAATGCGKKEAAGTGGQEGPAPTEPGAHSSGIEATYLIIGFEIGGNQAADEEIAKDSEIDRTVKIGKDQIQLKLFKRETLPARPVQVAPGSRHPLGGAGQEAGGELRHLQGRGHHPTPFVVGAKEPQFRPREFKTLSPSKGAGTATRKSAAS